MLPHIILFTRILSFIGAKIALYFCFTGHYTSWLCDLSSFSSIDLTKVSLIAVIYVSTSAIVNNSLDLALSGSYFLPFYCIYVSLWSQLMLEYWKRYACMNRWIDRIDRIDRIDE